MKIPVQMQPVYEEIAGMIDEYCEKYLNEEYRALCLRLLEKLCRNRPSPLLKGRRNTWAAGIVYESIPVSRSMRLSYMFSCMLSLMVYCCHSFY